MSSDPGEKSKIGALGWSAVNSLSARLLSIGVGLVIARLLTPAEFGTYALAYVVVTIALSFNELGASVVLMRSPAAPVSMAATAVTISLAGGVAIFLVLLVGAPWIASLLGPEELVVLIRIVSLNVLLDSLASVPNALLCRSFMQGRRTAVLFASAFPAAGVSIGLAAAGWGAESLAWGSIAGNVTAVVLLFALAPARPRPGWRPVHARTLLLGGLPLAAASLANLATLNVDYVVVGRMLGTEALGFYVLAFNISSWPSSLLSLSIRPVALPAFSGMVHDLRRLQALVFRSLRFLWAVTLLPTLLISLLAGPLVQVLYGDKWRASAEALRWLAILGGIRVMLDLVYDLLVALGRAGRLVAVQVGWLFALAVSLPVGAALGGIGGVAIGHVLVAIGVTGTAYCLTLQQSGFSIRAIAASFTGPAAAGLVAAGVLLLGLRVELPPWAAVIGWGSVVSLVYLALLALQAENRLVVAEVIGEVRGSRQL